MKQQNTHSASGFTLAEIVVVVGLIAIMASVAVSTVMTRTPEYRLNKASWQLLTDLRRARMISVTENTKVTVSFNEPAAEYSIWSDRNRNGSVDAGEEETKTLEDLPTGVLWTYPDTGEFVANGTFNSSWNYCYIQITEPSAGVKRIYIFPSGQIDPSFD